LGLLIALLFIKATMSPGEADTGAALLFISVPLFEIFFVSTMRIRQKKNPLKGSRDHFPLRLLYVNTLKSVTVKVAGRRTILQILGLATVIFLSGIGMLYLSTGLKIVIATVDMLMYISIWVMLAKVKTD